MEVSGVIEEIFADLGLTGKVVIVTGAGTGIGAATAIRLARSGAHVSLIGRTSETLTNVQHIIEEFGGKALCVTADMSDEGSGRTIVDATLESAGARVVPRATIAPLAFSRWNASLKAGALSSSLVVVQFEPAPGAPVSSRPGQLRIEASLLLPQPSGVAPSRLAPSRGRLADQRIQVVEQPEVAR